MRNGASRRSSLQEPFEVDGSRQLAQLLSIEVEEYAVAEPAG
jgi:hypothetical protein